MYWSGDGTSGACGIGPRTNLPAFLEIKLVRDGEPGIGEISLIAATWEASIFVARDAEGKNTAVFTCGVGSKGELGAGEMMVRTPTATRLAGFPPPNTEIVDLHACMGHVVAVLNNGDAYGWGNCRKGQAGQPAAVLYAPRKIEDVGFPVRRAVCCKEATCLFGDPAKGDFKVIGSDKWSLQSFAPATAPDWIDVGASWGNIYILTKQGKLEAWGRDDHGQLPPPDLPRLAQIAVGSEHVVALADTGDVLSWGWGEHGNCGPKVEDNIVKGRFNVIASSKFIPNGSAVEAIGAGCATSWVYIAETGNPA